MHWGNQVKHPGCNCEECPLGNIERCVPPEPASKPRPGISLIIIGEGPGRFEEEVGKPFVGATGKFLFETLARANISRGNVTLDNATLCRPDRKLTPKEWRAAVAACRGHILSGITGGDTVLALGAKALMTLVGHAKITPWVGAKLEGPAGSTVFVSFHPAAAMRKPALYPVTRRFILRAADHVINKRRDWEWPPIIT